MRTRGLERCIRAVPGTVVAGLCLMLSLPVVASEQDIPIGCRFGDSAGQQATLACYQDLDRNGDGALTPQEAEALPRIRGRFGALDADGDGALSPDEFQGELTTPTQRGGAKGV